MLKGHKTLGNKLTSSFDPYQKTEDILSKAGFTGFYAFFLGPDHPEESALFQHRAAPPSVIVSGLSQAGEVGSQDIRRLLADRMRTQALSKPRGKGSSPPFSIVPQVLL